MKRVHSTKQLAHLFCHMTNGNLEGFRTSSKNIYFENGILYSYGPHYPMAAKYQTGEGLAYREVILINSTKSSVTTQKHKSMISSAHKPDQWRFWVPNVKDPHDPDNLVELENDIIDVIDAVIKGSKHYRYIDICLAIDRYNQYSKVFNFKPFKSLDIDFDIILRMLDYQNQQRLARLEKAKNDREAIKDAKIKLKTQDEIKSWLNYETLNFPQSLNKFLDFDYCRIKKSGDLLETQKGAEVPLSHVKISLDFIDKGLSIQNQSIGPFKINSEVDINGNVKIGCHTINVNQVKNVMTTIA